MPGKTFTNATEGKKGRKTRMFSKLTKLATATAVGAAMCCRSRIASPRGIPQPWRRLTKGRMADAMMIAPNTTISTSASRQNR